ncbi:MAG: aldo/keto reductase [Nocardioidaceae bacterium]|nr:aldo/keto reductase [Nocardioidaceae bacterium]
MQQRYVGDSGLKVSRLALGTMTWGQDTDEHEAKDQLTAFVGAGGTMIDTAAGYTDGRSEKLVGSLLGQVVAREDLVLATKAGIWRRGNQQVTDTSRGALLRGLDTSLRRLGTDYLDLWQVHLWSDDVPLEETLSALDYAVSSGRARYVGISNYSGWQSARAVTLQQSVAQRAPIVSTQIEYSLVNRRIEREALPAAAALGLGVFPWSPLGRGVLTGKYRSGTPSDSRAASAAFAGFVETYLDERGHRIVEAVCRAADGLGWEPLEVALAWVRDAPGVTAPVLGARTARQLKAALAAEAKTLPAEIRRALDDVSEGAR